MRERSGAYESVTDYLAPVEVLSLLTNIAVISRVLFRHPHIAPPLQPFTKK